LNGSVLAPTDGSKCFFKGAEGKMEGRLHAILPVFSVLVPTDGILCFFKGEGEEMEGVDTSQ